MMAADRCAICAVDDAPLTGVALGNDPVGWFCPRHVDDAFAAIRATIDAHISVYAELAGASQYRYPANQVEP